MARCLRYPSDVSIARTRAHDSSTDVCRVSMVSAASAGDS